MKKYNILLIEDDRKLSDGIVLGLKGQNYNIRQCFSLGDVENLGCGSDDCKSDGFGSVDLVILDINLPDGSGFEYLKKLRENNNTQVIILTANDLEADIVKGFELGADDYITKPFSLAVLRARVNARLRAATTISTNNANSSVTIGIENNIYQNNTIEISNNQNQNNATDRNNNQNQNAAFATDTNRNIYRNPRFMFDFDRMLFSVKDKHVELSKSEQKLLFLLVSNKGIILERGMLLDRIWADIYDCVDENALSVTVKRLRDKLEDDASKPQYIKTIYGIGYRFED